MRYIILYSNYNWRIRCMKRVIFQMENKFAMHFELLLSKSPELSRKRRQDWWKGNNGQ